jgi:hypothetical protein
MSETPWRFGDREPEGIMRMTLRIDSATWAKLNRLAGHDRRTLNQEIQALIDKEHDHRQRHQGAEPAERTAP